MCLAIPVSIREIEGTNGKVEMGGVKRVISLRLTPEAKIGDYVLVHAGYAVGMVFKLSGAEIFERVDEKEAAETLKLFEEMSTISGNEFLKEPGS